MAANDGYGIQASRHDLDGARDWMALICGPHGLEVRHPGDVRFRHSGTVLRSTACTLGYVEYGTDVTVLVRKGAPLNCYSISLPLTGEQKLAMRGRLWSSDEGKGLIVSPEETQELAIGGNCRKIIVSIPRPALRTVLETLLQRPLDGALVFQPDMDAANGDQAAWWRLVKFVLGEMEQSAPLLNHSYLTADIEHALLKGLLLSQPHNYFEELATLRSAPPHYLRRARQFIVDNARNDIALEDIERAAGVSRYRLFEAFRQHFGQSPMAFVRRFRLEGVRRDLLEHRSEHNVSSIAMSWGFSHLGRFSSEYKDLFGETPSQTLKRTRVR
ncbi:AraC family transcriptional regulator [Paraburkholderia phymatum]|uniref:AraC family transcriptional regulator n=1 Tax=Paraburkholderia TaxID=1822464 RepID=UPI003178F057